MSDTPVMLITGGSRGIGAATAAMAASRGYDIVFSYSSNTEAAATVQAAVEAHGRRCVTMQADAGVEAEVAALFERADAEFERLDSVIVNAGILFERARVEDMTVERINRVLAVNVVGAFVTCREAVRRMSTDHGGAGGSIVILSSAASRLGSANEFVDYAASKGATDSLTIGLANEVATKGIRVNAVRPGLIHTDIHLDSGATDRVGELQHGVPMKRGGTADEVAEAVMWLASDASSYITGTFTDVTGGR
ncbi:MAG: NAD(P)-dependent dehydrogenase (short-subunit alcohol dehydrogenase family) [Candidatus Poriferisodalaceae bacterium]|jgi:NAD(P)-dependent dehydrogenase (short-subunit alcohol dehydrogenase family)